MTEHRKPDKVLIGAPEKERQLPRTKRPGGDNIKVD
jgi:hypothetical protein